MDAAIKAIANVGSLYFLRNDNVGKEWKEDFLKSRVCQLIVCTTKDYQRLPKTTIDYQRRPTGPLTFGHVLFSSDRQQTTVRRVSGGTIQYRIETIIKRAQFISSLTFRRAAVAYIRPPEDGVLATANKEQLICFTGALSIDVKARERSERASGDLCDRPAMSYRAITDPSLVTLR